MESEIEEHKLTHSDTTPRVYDLSDTAEPQVYKCSYCPLSTTKRAVMKNHVMVHTGQKHFLLAVKNKSLFIAIWKSHWWEFSILSVEWVFSKKNFGGYESFLWGPWYPCFGLLVTSALVSEPGWIPHLSAYCLCTMNSSGSSLVRHLLTSWRPAWSCS